MSFPGIEPKHLPESRPVSRESFSTTRLEEVFLEMYQLLEEYAPVWYTQEHHNRAATLVRELRGA